MFDKLALGAIWGYQQYISPRKGFRCAYAVHHGGTGCSGYAKHAIREYGFWGALPAIRHRLRACKEAYAEIRANCACRTQASDDRPLSENERKELERRRKKDGRCCTKTDACLCCGEAPFACMGSAGRGAASNKACDINPCDGDIGIGGCDCASCDCSGCSCGG